MWGWGLGSNLSLIQNKSTSGLAVPSGTSWPEGWHPTVRWLKREGTLQQGRARKPSQLRRELAVTVAVAAGVEGRPLTASPE